jgi:predicted aspartyl protease
MVNMIVHVSGARYQALVAANETIPPVQNVRALIDTGASGTCIDPMVFQALQLQPTGSTPVLTPSTGNAPVDADTYDVAISIPAATPGQIGLVIHNMPVVASHLFAAQGFHALVGRDILRQCIFAYNGGSNLFTLAY